MSERTDLKPIFDKLMQGHDLESCEEYLNMPEQLKGYAERNFGTSLDDDDLLALIGAESFVKDELEKGNDDWEHLLTEAHAKLDAHQANLASNSQIE